LLGVEAVKEVGNGKMNMGLIGITGACRDKKGLLLLIPKGRRAGTIWEKKKKMWRGASP